MVSIMLSGCVCIWSKQELDQAGLTPGAARDRGRSILDGVAKAVSSAGSAAAGAARNTENA